MSTSIQIVCLLRNPGMGPEEFTRKVLQWLDSGRLRYHFYSQGVILTHRRHPDAPSIASETEETIARESPDRVERAASLLLQREGKPVLGMDLDCGELQEGALVSIVKYSEFANVWVLTISVDSGIAYAEKEGGISCLAQFLRDGIVPLFDSEVGLFGRCGESSDDPDDSFVSAVLRGEIPDVFEYNVYPPKMAERNGLLTQGGVERLSKDGSILYESPKGTVVWDVKNLTGQFYKVTPQDRLTVFGFGRPDHTK